MEVGSGRVFAFGGEVFVEGELELGEGDVGFGFIFLMHIFIKTIFKTNKIIT